MIYVNTTFFLVLLGWSMFSPIICLALGAWIQAGKERNDDMVGGRE